MTDDTTREDPPTPTCLACGCPKHKHGYRGTENGFVRHCHDCGTDHDFEWTAADELHSRFAHPGWEYATTTGPRKTFWDADTPPEGHGWVTNTAASQNGWDRFEYHEESYWRRPKPAHPLIVRAGHELTTTDDLFEAQPAGEGAEERDWRTLGCARRSCGGGEHSRVWGDCALADEPPPDTTTLVGRVYTAEDGHNSTAIYRTNLHWAEAVGTDKAATGREVSFPVADDDGRIIGQINLSYADAGVLGAMLADAAGDEAPTARTRFVRYPADDAEPS